MTFVRKASRVSDALVLHLHKCAKTESVATMLPDSMYDMIARAEFFVVRQLLKISRRHHFNHNLVYCDPTGSAAREEVQHDSRLPSIYVVCCINR